MKKGILQRLSEGPVLGDGGFTHALEKRGYVRIGSYTPECAFQYPEAVRQLHREFLRAGSDVLQSYTFYTSEDNLNFTSGKLNTKYNLSMKEISEMACTIAKEVAAEGDALVAAGINEIPAYKEGKGKSFVQNEFRKQCQIYADANVDFIVCEFFNCIEEMEWAIEVAKEFGKPVAATMYIGPIADFQGVPTGECAVRMAKAGADIVGINCQFDPNTSLETIQVMKKELDKHDLRPHLMVQAQGYWAPEIKDQGVHIGTSSLPENPLAIDVRTLTRFEAAKYARDCLNLGVKYIGGCCGFEARHIRAMSEELEMERGKMCQATKELGYLADGLISSVKKGQHARANSEYWKNLIPATGRPYSPALATVPKQH